MSEEKPKPKPKPKPKSKPMTGVGKGNNPNSRKALQPNKGQGVPNAGRKVGAIDVKSRILKYMDIEIPLELPNGNKETATVADSIIVALIQQAQRGNIKAAELLFDRGYGKQAETINVKDDTIENLGTEYSQRLQDAYGRFAQTIEARPGVDYTSSVKD